MNLPNILTFTRILLIPVLVLLFYLPIEHNRWLCSVLFLFAALTDWLDGYLARKMNQMTPLGAFLDPVADKLMVATALVLLVESNADTWLTLPATVIVGREIVISALREWMAELGKRASVAVSYIGKVKTAMQMAAITVLLSQETESYLNEAGYVLLYIAALLTLWSMIMYIKSAWPYLSGKE